jgi:hypothetical protein
MTFQEGFRPFLERHHIASLREEVVSAYPGVTLNGLVVAVDKPLPLAISV